MEGSELHPTVEEIREALKIHMNDAPRTWEAVEASKVVDAAARKVANPDIEAARESVDMPGVMLLLWRMMELMGVSTAEFPERDTTGFAMMIRDSIVNKELFDAALGIEGAPDAEQ